MAEQDANTRHSSPGTLLYLAGFLLLPHLYIVLSAKAYDRLIWLGVGGVAGVIVNALLPFHLRQKLFTKSTEPPGIINSIVTALLVGFVDGIILVIAVTRGTAGLAFYDAVVGGIACLLFVEAVRQFVEALFEG